MDRKERYVLGLGILLLGMVYPSHDIFQAYRFIC